MSRERQKGILEFLRYLKIFHFQGQPNDAKGLFKLYYEQYRDSVADFEEFWNEKVLTPVMKDTEFVARLEAFVEEDRDETVVVHFNKKRRCFF